MSPLPLLEARKLSLENGRRRLCDNLDLCIEPGTCWGILGPNGAGKSTLLHTLAGLRPASGGQLLFRGQPLHELPARDRARMLGVLFQHEENPLVGTLFESVLAGRHPHLGPFGWESARDLAIASACIRALGLQGLEMRNPLALSGGERQRMEIATLLAQEPRLALLDEPVNHLDPGWQITLLRLLRQRFATGDRALVMVLHDVNLALRFCDRILLLRGDGQWRAGRTKTLLAREEHVAWVYGHPVRQITGPAGRCFLFS